MLEPITCQSHFKMIQDIKVFRTVGLKKYMYRMNSATGSSTACPATGYCLNCVSTDPKFKWLQYVLVQQVELHAHWMWKATMLTPTHKHTQAHIDLFCSMYYKQQAYSRWSQNHSVFIDVWLSPLDTQKCSMCALCFSHISLITLCVVPPQWGCQWYKKPCAVMVMILSFFWFLYFLLLHRHVQHGHIWHLQANWVGNGLSTG